MLSLSGKLEDISMTNEAGSQRLHKNTIELKGALTFMSYKFLYKTSKAANVIGRTVYI